MIKGTLSWVGDFFCGGTPKQKKRVKGTTGLPRLAERKLQSLFGLGQIKAAPKRVGDAGSPQPRISLRV